MIFEVGDKVKIHSTSAWLQAWVGRTGRITGTYMDDCHYSVQFDDDGSSQGFHSDYLMAVSQTQFEVGDKVRVNNGINTKKYDGETGEIADIFYSNMFGRCAEVRVDSGYLVDCHLEDLKTMLKTPEESYQKKWEFL